MCFITILWNGEDTAIPYVEAENSLHIRTKFRILKLIYIPLPHGVTLNKTNKNHTVMNSVLYFVCFPGLMMMEQKQLSNTK